MPSNAGPGQQAVPNPIKADPGHAAYHDGNSGKLRAEQQPANEGRNPQ
jgi:hypothetical protein